MNIAVCFARATCFALYILRSQSVSHHSQRPPPKRPQPKREERIEKNTFNYSHLILCRLSTTESRRLLGDRFRRQVLNDTPKEHQTYSDKQSAPDLYASKFSYSSLPLFSLALHQISCFHFLPIFRDVNDLFMTWTDSRSRLAKHPLCDCE